MGRAPAPLWFTLFVICGGAFVAIAGLSYLIGALT